MTTLALLLLRTLSVIFYFFFVIALPVFGIVRIEENSKANVIEGILMIAIGGAFFFATLRYVKRKMINGKSSYKDYNKSHKKAKAFG